MSSIGAINVGVAFNNTATQQVTHPLFASMNVREQNIIEQLENIAGNDDFSMELRGQACLDRANLFVDAAARMGLSNNLNTFVPKNIDPEVQKELAKCAPALAKLIYTNS